MRKLPVFGPTTPYAMEAFVHYNGPPIHLADNLLVRALERHFGKDKDGNQKPFHIVHTEASLSHNKRRLKNAAESQVMKRLKGERGQLGFVG